MNIRCPCSSSKQYKQCCKRFHDGTNPPTSIELMRSRYAAYALRQVDYIIKTTHPDYPGRMENLKEWRKDLLKFTDGTRFEGLTILDNEEGEERSTVTFRAQLRQGARDASFTEKSTFLRVDGRWLYRSGEGLPDGPW